MRSTLHVLRIALALCLVSASPTIAVPTRQHTVPIPSDGHAGRAPAVLDTVWYGGTDANGVAIRGGIWDFEDGTLQGWTSRNRTIHGDYFRLVTHADFASDPEDAVINGDWSMWVGRHEPETLTDCWEGGQGYGNNWVMEATRTFAYGGSGDLTIAFDYFVDTDAEYDFVYVYVGGSTPANTSANPNASGWGYSGGVEDFPPQSIGTPSAPASDVIIIPEGSLPLGGGDFDIRFRFVSDAFLSDEGGPLYLNDSRYGAFGFDDFSLDQEGTALDLETTFESGTTEGWSTSTTSVPTLIGVADNASLDPIPGACSCPLNDEGNDYLLLAADLMGPTTHPRGQWEELTSPPIYLADPVDAYRDNRIVQYSSYEGEPSLEGVGYAFRTRYYPWTCPETGAVGWSQADGFNGFPGPPTHCTTTWTTYYGYVPADAESLRIVFLVASDCDFGCAGEPDPTLAMPYFDNVRLGMVGSDVPAPEVYIYLTYQDRYPEVNSLCAEQTADPKAYYDNNRADTDPTNADMGDSIVVLAPGANTHVYLNYRVHPGPRMDTLSPGGWYQREYVAAAGAPGAFARVRMDTVETNGTVSSSRYASYVHEGDRAFTPPELNGAGIHAAHNKIIENDVLTPGTMIEYFFSSSFGPAGSNPVSVWPDTTPAGPGSDPFFLEFEILPGVFEAGGVVFWPSFLYVDAYNYKGVPALIEDYGLRPVLGTTLDDAGKTHDNWDRYDYTGAGSIACAPMAREFNGDNGMTKYQSLAYSGILYNTGWLEHEGLRDGDARLLMSWLDATILDRDVQRSGLWLNGHRMGSVLSRTSRPDVTTLRTSYCQIERPDMDPYDQITGDESECVRLDESSGALFPGDGAGFSYSAVPGDECWGVQSEIITPLGTGVGLLEYVDQDAGEIATPYASIATDRFDPTPGTPSYGVVTDAFSLHDLRAFPNGGTSSGGCVDPSAIGGRVADVLEWFDLPALAVDADAFCTAVATPDAGAPSTAAPAQTRLLANAPNPFNPTTTIRYTLAERAHVVMEVFDVTGARVRRLVDAPQDPSAYTISWDGVSESGSDVSSGVYWVRMTTSAGYRGSTKMVVLK